MKFSVAKIIIVVVGLVCFSSEAGAVQSRNAVGPIHTDTTDAFGNSGAVQSRNAVGYDYAIIWGSAIIIKGEAVQVRNAVGPSVKSAVQKRNDVGTREIWATAGKTRNEVVTSRKADTKSSGLLDLNAK